ncbi:expressed unknown protein [Seminavis robusta]|uniref:MYND-type domain-containing protein n=1 Tax=Seminavis robusta TaxID=568900 RepID=A0A9N8H617_9STRA|nr:expressed unknown protein [Seminavis robusta]|eukprot:Sro158_g071510.1 n/a (589) ;mRNA; f:28468-30234
MTVSSSGNSSLVEERRRAIERCIDWVETYGRQRMEEDGSHHDYPHVLKLDRIEFVTTTSSDSDKNAAPMVGLFAKESIRKGDTLVTIPEACVLSESHPLLMDLARVCIDSAMKAFRDNLTTQWKQKSNTRNPWNSFANEQSQGRVLCLDELRLALQLTLLVYAHRVKASIGGTLGDAATHFKSYLEALPPSYESLIFNWTDEEMELLKGTACHAVALRLRREVEENWEQSFASVLEEYLQQQLQPNDKVDSTLLKESYFHAICSIYSRMHSLDAANFASTTVTAETNTRTLCPLLDMLNGDKEYSPRCNVHVLHYPGIHVAVQATRDIAKGDEVIFSYGQISSQVFVTKFGFVPVASTTGKPLIDGLDVVHVVPPPKLVWEEGDERRWKSLTSDKNKVLERRHLTEFPPEDGTPFAFMGSPIDMAKVRGSESWRPVYLNNLHLYALFSLSNDDGAEVVVEPFEPGSIILDMIDYRLDQMPTIDDDLVSNASGNKKTAILCRMLEREILTMWRHAIAKQYECYGETSPTTGKKYLPLRGQKEGCAVCQTAFSGPLKSCTRCKAVFYCGRGCQKEDWKAGHKEACKPVSS